MKPQLDLRRDGVVCLALIGMTLAVFGQVWNHGFLCYDDDKYVTQNRHVRAGLTRDGILWALSGVHDATWHPFTSLSHMLDVEVYGLNPRGHHMSNVALHVANSLLLYLMLRRMTGAMWRSAFVAALFAIHPFHVEPVAWIASRKDVLSTLFWLLTLLAYGWYVQRRTSKRYLPVILLFTIGLMSKPMLVTLPVTLLLLDYWPLKRLKNRSEEGESPSETSLLALLLEKLPLFVLSCISCVVAFVTQSRTSALRTLEAYPLSVRMENAFVAYVRYIEKAVWPQDFSVFYPHPAHTLSIWQAVLAGLALLGTTVLVLAARRRRYLVVGWMFYLITLAPVIGIVQVGSQAMADRYAYVPLVGLFIMAAWGIPDLVGKGGRRALGLRIAAGSAISALMVCAWLNVRNWRDSETLFRHALAVTQDNALAHSNLGSALLNQGRVSEAVEHIQEALRLEPDFVAAHVNLGIALGSLNRLDEAVSCFSRALQLDPRKALVHYNLGAALSRQGNLDAAAREFSEVLEIDPENADARSALDAVRAAQQSSSPPVR